LKEILIFFQFQRAALKFKLHAFGVINHLSRFRSIAVTLVESNFVDEILCPALHAAERPEEDDAGEPTLEQEATLARAALALANLSTTGGSREVLLGRRAAGSVVKVLDFALRGETLATITWLPANVLGGVCSAALQPHNAEVMLECGLAHTLARLLAAWEAEAGLEPLRLGLCALDRLSVAQAGFGQLWAAGLVEALHTVAGRARRMEGAEAEEARGLAGEAESVASRLQARHLAVCMGQQRRLGRGSSLMLLDESLLHMVLTMAYPPPSSFDGPPPGAGTALPDR
jgi:hypothetical protein